LCYKHHFDLPHVIATGGETRFHTVRNSLAVAVQGELIAIHDGVRPLVSHETLDRCFLMAAEKGSAIPCIPVSDSVRMKKENDSIPVDRELYRLIQTPQVFRREILEKAFQQNYQAAFTDDASVVERAGYPVFLVDGNPENIKITTRVDLAIAGALLNNKFD
jgi:2-C-methyl-D-erythritol 4-phosphate cytidylyltransferase